MSKEYHVIGLMSGSSLDGLDIAYCKFVHQTSLSGEGGWNFEILKADTHSLGDWEGVLRNAPQLSSKSLEKLSQDFAEFLALEVRRFIDYHQISKLDLVVSHGHTIYHYPELGKTCQIGNGKLLSKRLGFPVVSNLRQKDVDLGGQGAPIVPIGDKHLFKKFLACLNLGGIANLSIKFGDGILAFDVCVANQVLNHYAKALGENYDDKGKLARSGNLNKKLLDFLNQEDYFSKEFPKSLDNSYSTNQIVRIEKLEQDARVVLRTYVEHIAMQIGKSIENVASSQGLKLDSSENLLITGGGAFNIFLVERIQAHTKLQVEIPERKIIEFKEALVMGFIGILRLRNEVNVLASVTGAKEDSSSGDIHLP